MSDTTQARKQYKYIVLNSESIKDTETRINDAAADGFVIDHVIPGYQRGRTTWSYAALVMSKDAAPQ